MKYALQMNFQVLKTKNPKWAAVLEKHINAHKSRMQRTNMQGMLNAIPKQK